MTNSILGASNYSFMHNVIATATCPRHKADKGVPCWIMSAEVNGETTIRSAICGKRAKKAGYNGRINPGSLMVISSKRRSTNNGRSKNPN